MTSAPADMRYEFKEASKTRPWKDMVSAVSNAFDELYLSVFEGEVLHPSEESHRQRWLASDSKIFDQINSYHVFCRLCNRHFYSRSVPTDINSFFQEHINTDYHREFRELPFPPSEEMISWEKNWVTGKCNVCEMSALCAFVRDMNCSPKSLLDQHHCIGNLSMQDDNLQFLRKISLLRKYCRISVFREKLIKPLREGSVCLLCSSKIPFSGEDVRVHLGSSRHLHRFFSMVWNQLYLSPKDLLNGFNLELVTQWFYSSSFAFPEQLQSLYKNYRLECLMSSSNTSGSDRSSSSGHYCPQIIENLLAYHPSDFIRDNMCLLCNQPTVDACHRNNFHFNSAFHKIKLADLSESSFSDWNNYTAFCANRDNRLRRHVDTIEKYKQLKAGTHVQSFKVGLKIPEQKFVKKLFLEKLLLVKNPPPKSPSQNRRCEVCDLRIPATCATNHEIEFRHLFFCKKWEELEQRAADGRFFEPFQRCKHNIVCLLCGVIAQGFSFFAHLKGTLHAKRFQWYCNLENEIPISSAIEVKPDFSVVCYLCDRLLVKATTSKDFKINLKSVRKHWPCPSINTLEEDPLRLLNWRNCKACGNSQGRHEKDCATNSLDWTGVENAVRSIVTTFEDEICKRVLGKTKSTFQQAGTASAEDEKWQQEAACDCEESSSQCISENADDEFQIGEKDLKIEKTDDEYEEEETNEEILIMSGLRLTGSRKSRKLVSKLLKFGKLIGIHMEGDTARVKFAKKGVAEKVAANVDVFSQENPSVTITVEVKKGSGEENKGSGGGNQERVGKFNFSFIKSNLPPMPPDLLVLLEEPIKLLEVVANLTAAATAAAKSPEELAREKSVCATINNAVLDLFPYCRCYPFGSRLSGLMFNNSDLDVFLDCGGLYEGMENMSTSAQRKIIHQIAKALRSKPEVTHLIIIDRARVPIISFFHKTTGLHCDLSFKNALSVHNTLLIKFLASIDYQVKFFIVFLKYWVKKTGLHGPPYFSSYAITMMAIFYLQQLKPPMVPTVEALQKAYAGRRLTIGGWDCSFSESTEGLLMEKCNLPFHIILEGFFNYFANFDYKDFAISPLDGKPLPREVFSPENSLKLPMCYKKHILNFPQPMEYLLCERIPICVIDPFDLSHVLTKSFSPAGLEVFKFYCKLSAECLKKSVTHLMNLKQGSNTGVKKD